MIGSATILSFVLGTLLGVVVAWKRDTWVDSMVPATMFFAAVPYFWLALIALTVFSVSWHLLPVSGGYNSDVAPGLNLSFLLSAAGHAILPVLTILASSLAGWTLGMRNMMLTTLGEDWVLVGEAKGLRKRRVMLTYAARNAILPNVASFAMSLGFVVSGAILTEIVFSYPGIGYILYQAIQNEDYPLLQAIFLIISLTVLAANFIADLVYVLLDPRTRAER